MNIDSDGSGTKKVCAIFLTQPVSYNNATKRRQQTSFNQFAIPTKRKKKSPLYISPEVEPIFCHGELILLLLLSNPNLIGII